MNTAFPTDPCPTAADGMDADHLLCCAMDVAALTLRCGGDIHRVEETITRICQSYGAQHVEVSAITSMIHATVRLPDGSMSSQMRRISGSDNDLGQLERCNALSRRICAERPSYDEVQACVQQLKACGLAPLWQMLLGAALCSGGFAIFFGGTLPDGVAAAVVSIFMTLLSRYALPFANQFARTLMMSLCGSLLSYAAVTLGFGNHADKIMIGTIMCVIPGLALGRALRDLLSDDTLSGVLQLFRSLLIAVTIALGYTAGILLCGGDTEFSYDLNSIPLQALTSVIGPLGVCLMYRLRPNRLPAALCGSLLSYAVYALCFWWFGGDFFPNLLATVVVGFYARALAQRFKFPAVAVSTPAILPLLPGGLLYYTMHHMMVGQVDTAMHFALRTITVALAIGAGEVAVSLVHLAVLSQRAAARAHRNTSRPS